MPPSKVSTLYSSHFDLCATQCYDHNDGVKFDFGCYILYCTSPRVRPIMVPKLWTLNKFIKWIFFLGGGGGFMIEECY